MDPDADWMLGDDSSAAVGDASTDIAATGSAADQVEDWLASSVTAGAPVPNPYAHVVSLKYYIEYVFYPDKHLEC